MFAPSCLICQCVVGFFQLHEKLVVASRFIRVVDQRQLLVLRLDLLLICRDTHLVHICHHGFCFKATSPPKSHRWKTGEGWKFG